MYEENDIACLVMNGTGCSNSEALDVAQQLTQLIEQAKAEMAREIIKWTI